VVRFTDGDHGGLEREMSDKHTLASWSERQQEVRRLERAWWSVEVQRREVLERMSRRQRRRVVRTEVDPEASVVLNDQPPPPIEQNNAETGFIDSLTETEQIARQRYKAALTRFLAQP
jgi:hypothetical protein